MIRILDKLLGGRPMTCVDERRFVDVVSGRIVGLYRDKFGRKWLADRGAWSLFRVKSKERLRGGEG